MSWQAEPDYLGLRSEKHSPRAMGRGLVHRTKMARLLGGSRPREHELGRGRRSQTLSIGEYGAHQLTAARTVCQRMVLDADFIAGLHAVGPPARRGVLLHGLHFEGPFARRALRVWDHHMNPP